MVAIPYVPSTRLRDRREIVALVEHGYQVRKDLGVRLREELDAALLESGAKRGVVLYDAVVDERQAPAVRHVRVRVRSRRKPVRRPARMRYADRVLGAALLGESARKQLVELRDLSGLLVDLYAVLGLERDACGVVAAVLEPPETADERTHSRRAP